MQQITTMTITTMDGKGVVGQAETTKMALFPCDGRRRGGCEWGRLWGRRWCLVVSAAIVDIIIWALGVYPIL